MEFRDEGEEGVSGVVLKIPKKEAEDRSAS